MSTGTITPSPYQQEIDGNGEPISGALIYTYVAGTSTPATTYTTAALNVQNTNPIVADSAGRWVAWLVPGNTYKECAALPVTPIPPPSSPPSFYWTQDGIAAIPGSAQALDITGILGESVIAGNYLYLSDGSGSKTTGRWYLADSTNAYSSVTPETGFAVSAGSSGDSITIRQGGQITGLSGLVAGSIYYAGLAGALTVTVPLNARFVGQADSTTTLITSPNPPVPLMDNGVNDFRLTLTTGVPVTSADVLAATIIYLTPSGKGNRIALYNAVGAATICTSAQISIAVPNTTTQMYDIFGYNNAGVPTLELLAWTNDTSRATAIVLTTTGTYTKSGDLTRRYLGSFRTTGSSGQTEDSAAKRYLWNYYNRVTRVMRVLEATDSWAYTTATFRQANGATGNQLDYVVGVAEVVAESQVIVTAKNDQAVGVVSIIVAIGEDSTTTPSTNCLRPQVHTWTANVLGTVFANLRTVPAVGRHTLVWLEWSVATGTTTWFGDNGAALLQSGIHGSYQG